MTTMTEFTKEDVLKACEVRETLTNIRVWIDTLANERATATTRPEKIAATRKITALTQQAGQLQEELKSMAPSPVNPAEIMEREIGLIQEPIDRWAARRDTLINELNGSAYAACRAFAWVRDDNRAAARAVLAQDTVAFINGERERNITFANMIDGIKKHLEQLTEIQMRYAPNLSTSISSNMNDFAEAEARTQAISDLAWRLRRLEVIAGNVRAWELLQA